MPLPTPTPDPACGNYCYPPWLQVGSLFKIPELDKLYPCEVRCNVMWKVLEIGKSGWIVVSSEDGYMDVRVNFAELKFLVQVLEVHAM